ncbi:MAG: cytidylate kinase-like family protein [Bacteroidales bacterium]
MNPKFYINIGRELGSGGLEIGEKLSRMFNISFYDKELINVASKESGISKEFFEKADEIHSQSFSSGFFGLNFSSIFADVSAYSVLDNSELFKIQSNVIKRVASNESAVFVGRCADYILREEQNCLNVFITASVQDRILRLRNNKKLKGIEKLSESQIKEHLEKIDKQRSNYYNYFTYKTWGAAKSYDMCLDSSYLGIDKCVEIIATVVKEKFVK